MGNPPPNENNASPPRQRAQIRRKNVTDPKTTMILKRSSKSQYELSKNIIHSVDIEIQIVTPQKKKTRLDKISGIAMSAWAPANCIITDMQHPTIGMTIPLSRQNSQIGYAFPHAVEATAPEEKIVITAHKM